MLNGRGISWAIAVIVALVATTATADPQSDWVNQLCTILQRQWSQTTDRLPMMDAKKPSRSIAEAISLSLENGNLVLRTSLPATPAPASAPGQILPPNLGAVRLKIDPWTEWASLRITRSAPKDQTPVIPETFQLGLAAFSAGHLKLVQVYRATTDGLTLAMTWQTPQGLASATFSEEGKDDDYHRPHACRIQVIVQHLGKMPEVVRFGAEDFAAMLRDHPDQTRRFLRPLLHGLGGDAVFGIEPPVGWQVFGNTPLPDPKFVDAVNKVLPALAGGTFRQRTDARKSLEAMGMPGELAILRLDRSMLTPEQNAQLDCVIAPFRQLSDRQAEIARTDPQFLVDCLYSSDQSVRQSAIERLRKISRLDLPFDPAADSPARNATVVAIRGKLVEYKLLSDP